MGGSISVYNLGKLGVNVDKSPAHLDDGELTKSQNAIRDPLGLDGGLRKRPGLVEFNGVAAGGSILGGIGVPIGLTNVELGAGSFGGLVRTIYWGKMATSNNLGATSGWWTSIDVFASAAGTISAGSPANPRAAQTTPMDTNPISLMTGMPGAAVVVKNKLYYAANSYTSGSQACTIRIWDGTTDKEFCRLPNRPYAGHSIVTINSMLSANGTIYVSAMTATDSSTPIGGFVYDVDPFTAEVRQLGPEFTSTYVPYALCWHQNRLWMGTLYRQDTSQKGRVYRINPDVETTWTLDRTQANGRGVGILISYGGQLFAGAWGGNTNDVEVRSTLGVWSSSLSVASGAGSYFTSAVVFSGNLYVAHWVTSGSILTIRKFNGTAWSTPYTNSGGTHAAPCSTAIVVGSNLLFGGGGENIRAILLTSTDGASYTDRTLNLTSEMGLATIGALTL